MKQSSQTFQYLGERLFLCFPSLTFTPDTSYLSFLISTPLVIAAGCTRSLSWGNTGAWGLGTILSFCHSLFLTLFFCCSFLLMLFLSSNRVPHGLQFLLWHGLSMDHNRFWGALPALSCSAWYSSALFFPLSQLLPPFIRYVFTEVPLVSSEEPPPGPCRGPTVKPRCSSQGLPLRLPTACRAHPREEFYNFSLLDWMKYTLMFWCTGQQKVRLTHAQEAKNKLAAVTEQRRSLEYLHSQIPYSASYLNLGFWGGKRGWKQEWFSSLGHGSPLLTYQHFPKENIFV